MCDVTQPPRSVFVAPKASASHRHKGYAAAPHPADVTLLTPSSGNRLAALTDRSTDALSSIADGLEGAGSPALAKMKGVAACASSNFSVCLVFAFTKGFSDPNRKHKSLNTNTPPPPFQSHPIPIPLNQSPSPRGHSTKRRNRRRRSCRLQTRRQRSSLQDMQTRRQTPTPTHRTN